MARVAWKPNTCRWHVAPPEPGAEALAQRLHVAPLVAQVLCRRGLCDADAAHGFLKPRLTDLHDPEALPGTVAAARRIAKAIRSGETIVIYGDYDVDGMTATAILHTCICAHGGNVRYYVPHRLDEGYGVHIEALETLVADGANLICTVDCGISAGAELQTATASGVDVIVTDHHAVSRALPDVAAVVHPALPDDPSPNPDLCGAGVALKLAWQIGREIHGAERVDEETRELLVEATTLAALGTIADVVPLLGENRILATFGLQALPHTRHVGLSALLDSANLNGKRLDAFHVGFVLAPRLNAAGRMGHAREAVELLTTDDRSEADRIAAHLGGENTRRQKVEQAILESAVEDISRLGLDSPDHRSIVLASDAWHGGVIGIVASRLVERYSRPVVLIAQDETGEGHGSGRSVPGFDMARALQACEANLARYGGHAMAGGVTVAPEHIETFAEAFEAYAQEHLQMQCLQPILDIDAEATLEEMTYPAVKQLESMQPFGQGNPRPTVAMRDCELLTQPRRMGRSGRAISLLLGQGNHRIRAVGFSMGDLADALVGVQRVDVAGEPVLNTFNGRTTVELRLRDVSWE